MKNIITTIITSISMFSCQSKEEKMISNAEQYMKNELLDPNSFEKIESRLLTNYKSTQLKSGMSSDSSTASMFVTLAEGHVSIMKIWAGSYSSYGQEKFKESKKTAQRYSDSCRLYLDRQEEKKKEYNKVVNTPQDTIVGYSVLIRYYGMSRGGQKRMGESYVKLDVNGKPISHYTFKF